MFGMAAVAMPRGPDSCSSTSPKPCHNPRKAMHVLTLHELQRRTVAINSLGRRTRNRLTGEERFYANTPIREPDTCWEWQGHREKGYGILMVYGRRLYAHRISYFLTHGDIPAGLVVMHSCDNPPCANPAHLSVGTQGDNLRDMASKGRDRGGWKDNRLKTYCPADHEYTDENTYVASTGGRHCRECGRTRAREYQRARRRAERGAAA